MPHFQFKVLRSMREVPAGQWDQLEPRNLLTSHLWLSALEDSGVVSPGKALEYRLPVLTDGAGRVVAAAPGMLRHNSVGEFGPENLWIRRASGRGIRLLPKMQLEVPPVGFSVPKFLVHPSLPHDKAMDLLLRALIDTTRAGPLQALTLSRLAPPEAEAANSQGLVMSAEIGTLWHNEGFRNFTDHLARFKAYYRNAIVAERKNLRDQGVTVREFRGSQITAALWDAYFEGYQAVCRKLNSTPLFNREFLDRVGPVGDALWLFGNFSGDRFLSGCYAVQAGDTLYGGHWSEMDYSPNAIFEAALYRPVEVAIELGLQKIDQGGWGAHKPRRGFMPFRMPNAHWIRDPGVRADAEDLAAEHRRVFDEYNTPPCTQRYLGGSPKPNPKRRQGAKDAASASPP